MTKIAITGSIASGKTTASKFLSNRRGPLFSADQAVKKLYSNKKFKKMIMRKFSLKKENKFKKDLLNKIVNKKKDLKKLEKIIHPLVRKQMISFIKKNEYKKLCFCEIPLLIESRLKKYFDITIFVKSSRNLRIKRFKLKKGNMDTFNFLDKQQIKDNIKMKYCDHIVVNNKSLSILKKNLSNIIKLYE
tara:strand:- start:125 stop:691 length:567 start_codon:yes stop_codon:yes gene_type:complete